MGKRTLVISLQGIGNAILSLPAIRALREAGDEVSLLTNSPRILPLLNQVPDLRQTLAADAPQYRGPLGRLRLLRRVRRAGFDRAVFAFPSGSVAYLFARLAGIPERIGHVFPEIGRARSLLTTGLTPLRKGHDVEQNFQLLAALGLTASPAEFWPVLEVPATCRAAATTYLRAHSLDPAARYLGLHTGCDSAFVEKRWPAAHGAALIDRVYEKHGLPAIIMDGPAEPGGAERVARLAGAPVHCLDRATDLVDAWGLMACCDAFVSNDSGLMNLAAASDVPTVGVFGPSEAHRTRPYGSRGRAVVAGRTCVPCFGLGPYPGCPHPYDHCLDGVSPAAVAARVDELLQR